MIARALPFFIALCCACMVHAQKPADATTDLPSVRLATCLELSQLGLANGDLANAAEQALRALLIAKQDLLERVPECALQLARIHERWGVPEKSLEYAEMAAVHQGEDTTALVECQWLRANALANMERHRDAQAAFGKLYWSAKNNAQDRYLMIALSGLVNEALALNDMDEAQRHLHELAGAHNAANDRVHEGTCQNNIARILERQGRRAEAHLRFTKAKSLLSSDPILLDDVLLNEAALMAADNHGMEALQSIDAVLARCTGRNDEHMAARALLLKAATLQVEGRSLEALDVAQLAVEAAQRVGDRTGEAGVMDLMAHIHGNFGQHKLARSNAERAASLRKAEIDQQNAALFARQTHLLEVQRIEEQAVATITREEQEFKRFNHAQQDADHKAEQIELLRSRSQLKEAELQQEMEAATARHSLEAAHAALQAEQQLRRIQELEMARTGQALELARTEKHRVEQDQQLRHARQEAQLLATGVERDRARQQRTLWLVAFLLVLVGGAAYVLMITRRRSRLIARQNASISRINAELEQRNSDITSSIHYASTIQASIVPGHDQLRQHFRDSFLIYQPRDAVSGDLPFVLREGDHVYLAAIDCAGHGVPAAMLSFIAYYNLSEIIATSLEAPCGKLLQRLHERITHTLGRKASRTGFNDGMDISLCRLDTRTGELSFAGAQLPLVITQASGASEVIKGEMISIGDAEFTGSRVFTTHHRTLRPGDRVFLFSDGLVHQMGDTGRKFSLERLERLVSASVSTPLPQLGAQLEKDLEAWKGGAGQTDDILLIGFAA